MRQEPEIDLKIGHHMRQRPTRARNGDVGCSIPAAWDSGQRDPPQMPCAVPPITRAAGLPLPVARDASPEQA